MRIAVPIETSDYETRVAATPETVKKFIAAGCDVIVQKGAGESANLTDSAFEDAGASLADSFALTCQDADLVIKVRAPSKEELTQLSSGTALASLMSPFSNPLLKDYAQAGLRCFCLEMIPRISRAQSMDVLSSQANIAGYKAVLLALEHYKRFMPMLMTAAGTVQPARILIMGAGVAGLQAIATARRLGAIVEAFDVRAAAKEQVESLGAKFVEVQLEDSGDNADGEDAGGYAKEMSDEYKQKQAELIAEHAAKSDIIITTALIPGRPAPVLVTEETLAKMRPGSVIVDMAAEAGGNCPMTEKDAVWIKDGVTLIGTSNIPALMATDASQLLARNVLNFITPMLETASDDSAASLNINMEDEVIAASLICNDGEFLKPQLLGKKE
ncbi:MAG: Re/Si-specific NAD(P)(+) transhydrogenase subunit alpha [Mariprofundaceae bacterium]|nr:Re/Si-specific NAD(P)(+) transhydrogenase subunit alpha [Mariprofundaceae bacterium]